MAKNHIQNEVVPCHDGLNALNDLKQLELQRKLSVDESRRIRVLVDKLAKESLQTIETNNYIEHLSKIDVTNGHQLIIHKRFFKETFSKNKNDRWLCKTMVLSLRYEEWMPNSVYVRIEPGRDHPCSFLVYRATCDGNTIEFKVRVEDKLNVHFMRLLY